MFASLVTIDKPGYSPRLERRLEGRDEIHRRAVVKVINAEDQDQIGMEFHAEIVNVSSRGMRLSAEQLREFLDGGSFELWIDLDGYPAKFCLKGEARWVSWEENNEFHMGVEILNRFDTGVAYNDIS